MRKRIIITINPDDLASAYQAMAADSDRERKALTWSNALIGDANDIQDVISEGESIDQISLS
jgi:hypothetical protein